MALSKLAVKRLTRLCDYMESLPKSAAKHFDMSEYYSHSGYGHEHEFRAVPSVADLHTCGTSACALGWAVTDPYFRRAGLRVSCEMVCCSDEVFDIQEDYDAWFDLFGEDNKDESPKAWAKRVRKYIKEHAA